jgi:hypothetical protein
MAPGGKFRRGEVTCRTRLVRRVGTWEEHCRDGGGLAGLPRPVTGVGGKERERCAVGPDRPSYKLPFLPQQTRITGQYIKAQIQIGLQPKAFFLRNTPLSLLLRFDLTGSHPVSSFSSFFSAAASLPCAQQNLAANRRREPNPEEPRTGC